MTTNINWLKKRYLFLLTCLLVAILSSQLQAQSLAQNVIGNAGNFAGTTSGSIHWTIGEVVVENYENEVQLAQGFHQLYYDYIITSNEKVELEYKLALFPNPTSGELNLEIEKAGIFEIKIANALGQVFYQSFIHSNYAKFDLSQYPTGLYFLTVFQNGKLQKTFKIIKN